MQDLISLLPSVKMRAQGISNEIVSRVMSDLYAETNRNYFSHGETKSKGFTTICLKAPYWI